MNTQQFIDLKFQLRYTEKDKFVEIRNYGRDQLPELFAELGFTKGVEIGVEGGIYSKTMLDKIPNLTLYGVDPWLAYREYRDHVSQQIITDFYNEAMERLQGLNFKPIRKFSTEAAKEFATDSIDFVYIDGNHEFSFVADDIYEWSKKVRVGGIIAGHDYKETTRYDSRNHVVPVVDAFVRAYRIRPLILIGSKACNEGEIRDKPRSWMFVKPPELNKLLRI